MVTGHDIATKILNKKLSELKSRFKIASSKNEGFETVNTGGTKTFRKSGGSDYRYSAFINKLVDWRNFLVDGFRGREMNEEGVKIFFEKVMNDIFTKFLKNKKFSKKEKRFLGSEIRKIIFKIEKKTDTKGIFVDILEKSDFVHEVKLSITPWIFFSELDSVFIKIRDPYGFIENSKLLKTEGSFKTFALEGENEIKFQAEGGEKIRKVQLKGEMEKFLDPSNIQQIIDDLNSKIEDYEDENISYSDIVASFQKWMLDTSKNYNSANLDEKSILEILKNLNRTVFSELIDSKNIDEEKRNDIISIFYDVVSKIKGKSNKNGIFEKSLKKSDLLINLNIEVKPWLRFTKIEDAYVKVKDVFGFFSTDGKTDECGNFKTEALPVKNKILVKTKDMEKSRSVKLEEDEKVTIHTSIF